MSQLGAVPTAEETFKQADARSRRLSPGYLVFFLAVAVVSWQRHIADAWLWFVLGAVIVWNAYLVLRPAKYVGTKEREALEQSAYTDLRAAKRFRGILKGDLRGHALMRKYLPRTLPVDKHASAVQLIEHRDQQTRAQLAQIESIITQLRGK
jgi:hypothetical protein